jgi:hypothetical protein
MMPARRRGAVMSTELSASERSELFGSYYVCVFAKMKSYIPIADCTMYSKERTYEEQLMGRSSINLVFKMHVPVTRATCVE